MVYMWDMVLSTRIWGKDRVSQDDLALFGGVNQYVELDRSAAR